MMQTFIWIELHLACGNYLKTVEEIEENPRNDHVVIQSYEQSHNTTTDSDTSQPWMDGVPHSESTQPHLLTYGHLYQEQRYTFKY